MSEEQHFKVVKEKRELVQILNMSEQIQDKLKNKFFVYLNRNPLLCIFRLKKLFKLHRKEIQNHIRDGNESIIGTDTSGTRINVRYLEVFPKKSKNETLPFIPTIILLAVYHSNSKKEIEDRNFIKNLSKDEKNKKNKSSIEKTKKMAVFQRVMSLAQAIIEWYVFSVYEVSLNYCFIPQI